MANQGEFINEVAEHFADHVAAGTAIWQQNAASLLPSMPLLHINGNDVPAASMNALVLAQQMLVHHWADPRFVSAETAQQLGLTIRTGAPTTELQFIRSVGTDGAKLETPEAVSYTLFNASDVEGLPPWVANAKSWPLQVLADRLVPKFGIDIVHDQVKDAFFSKVDQKCHMPPMSAFASVGEYVGVAVHELAHGTADELDREVAGGPGEEAYAREELRVEMASMQLSVALGIPHDTTRHAGFAGGWVRLLIEDPAEIFRAARDAEKIAALVLLHVKAMENEMKIENGEKLSEVFAPRLDTKPERKGSTKSQWSERVKHLFDNRISVLAVAYQDRQRAQLAGAVYYAEEKIWFAPPGADMEKLKNWDPKRTSVSHAIMPSRMEMLSDFRQFMEAHDYIVEEKDFTTMLSLDDGKWGYVKVANPGNKYNRSGAYRLQLDGDPETGVPCATLYNHKSGRGARWNYDGPALTPEQIARNKAIALEREIRFKLVTELTQSAVASQASAAWGRASPGEHRYCQRKHIGMHDSRVALGGVLLEYPAFIGASGRSAIKENHRYLLRRVRDFDGKTWSLQAISEDGKTKTFLSDGKKKGNFDLIGADTLPTSGPLVFVEGFATGAKFHEATGWPVVNCFDAGNLEAVIEALVADKSSRLMPGVVPVVARDNDQFFVERAMAMISRVGATAKDVAPGQGSNVVSVESGLGKKRFVDLGGLVADGEWHAAPGGKYRMEFEVDEATGNIVGVEVDVVDVRDGPDERAAHLQMGNRGAQAAATALKALPSALVVTPEFRDLSAGDQPTDWDDLGIKEGVERIRELVREQQPSLAVFLPQVVQQRSGWDMDLPVAGRAESSLQR